MFTFARVDTEWTFLLSFSILSVKSATESPTDQDLRPFPFRTSIALYKPGKGEKTWSLDFNYFYFGLHAKPKRQIKWTIRCKVYCKNMLLLWKATEENQELLWRVYVYFSPLVTILFLLRDIIDMRQTCALLWRNLLPHKLRDRCARRFVYFVCFKHMNWYL